MGDVVADVDLHVAVGNGLDLRSLRVLCRIVAFAESACHGKKRGKPQETGGREILSVQLGDHANVTHQIVHRAVGTQKLVQNVVEKRQTVVSASLYHDGSLLQIHIHLLHVRHVSRVRNEKCHKPKHAQNALLDCLAQRVAPYIPSPNTSIHE